LGFPCPWIIGRITIEDMGAVFFQVDLDNLLYGYLVVIYIPLPEKRKKKKKRMYIVPITIRYLLIYFLQHAISLA
jgi:hypothetical protein